MAREVSTAAATLDAEYSVSEEESDASEALSEEVAATKQQVGNGLGWIRWVGVERVEQSSASL